MGKDNAIKFIILIIALPLALYSWGRGSIGYTYNLHGQISSITGTGFSQKLYYADGPFDKLSKPGTRPGSMDYPGKQQEMAFKYNEWGALVKDESRGITNIEYDNNGNPYIISYSDGSYSKNIYSANGEKLISELCTDLSAGINPLALTGNEDYSDISSYGISGNIRTEYRGPVIFRNGQIEMIRFPGGYATISGNNVIFHYYTQDYLGNNHAVVNGTTGAIEQTVAYYPFGGVIVDLGTGHSLQQYKFGGKELLTVNGLNEYDFGARRYYQAVPMFTQLDPFADKFPWLSPYVYCANNPINVIDPEGEIIETIWDVGNVLYDVGAAIYNGVKGNKEAVKSNLIDAGADLAAVLSPGRGNKGCQGSIRHRESRIYCIKGLKSCENYCQDI